MNQLTLLPRKNLKFLSFFFFSFSLLVVIHNPEFALQVWTHNDLQLSILKLLEREVGPRELGVQRPATNEHGVLIGGRKPAAHWNFLRIRVFTPISYRICQPSTTEIMRGIHTIDFTKDLCELLPKHDTQYLAVEIVGNLLVLAMEMEGSPVRHERIRS